MKKSWMSVRVWEDLFSVNDFRNGRKVYIAIIRTHLKITKLRTEIPIVRKRAWIIVKYY